MKLRSKTAGKDFTAPVKIEKTAKAPKVTKIKSGLYRMVRGTALHPLACVCRQEDYKGQDIGGPVQGSTPSVVLVQGNQGEAIVEAPVSKGTLKLDQTRSFKLDQFRQVRVMSLTEAVKDAKKRGQLRTISYNVSRPNGKWETRTAVGYLCGSLKNMGVTFTEKTGKMFVSLNTRAIRAEGERADGNKAMQFKIENAPAKA